MINSEILGLAVGGGLLVAVGIGWSIFSRRMAAAVAQAKDDAWRKGACAASAAANDAWRERVCAACAVSIERLQGQLDTARRRHKRRSHIVESIKAIRAIQLVERCQQ